MEREIEFYRTLIKMMRDFLTKHYSEPNITIITCLLDTYHSSMECAYSEYNKSSFISKLRWKKRIREQFRNIQQFHIRYIYTINATKTLKNGVIMTDSQYLDKADVNEHDYDRTTPKESR